MKVDELGNPNSDVIADFVEHNQNIIAAQKAIPLNRDGLTAYFDQMATDGKVETTVEWLVEVSLLIQSDVEKRLKHIHAERTGAIIKAAENLMDAIENSKRTINHRTQVTDVYFEMESTLTELKVTLEGNDG